MKSGGREGFPTPTAPGLRIVLRPALRILPGAGRGKGVAIIRYSCVNLPAYQEEQELTVAFALKCRVHELALLRAVFEESGSVMTGSVEDIGRASASLDIVFVGWGAGLDDWRDTEEERRLRNATATTILLTKLKKALAFKDVPVLILADERDLEDARSVAHMAAANVLQSPLDEARVRETVALVLRPAGQESRLDAGLVNPFIEATLHVLRAMARVEARRRDVFLKKDHRLFGEVSAILGISGGEIEGSVGLTFHEDLVRELVTRMWGAGRRPVSSEQINDGLGELVNVISGQAANQLADLKGERIAFTLPAIVTGHGHEIPHRSGAPCLVIVFEALGKPFAVQVAVSHK
ncbi:MAG: hypothetical protein GHCLOJNM_02695 [bacterium]|nr:hypothetical protein [bacterium]